MQSLRLKGGGEAAALVVKRFALPERFPFDTSDRNFAIANEVQVAVKGIAAAESLEKSTGTRAGDRERGREERQGRRQKAAKSASREESAIIKSKSAQSAETQAGAGTDATTGTLSASTNGGSFYVYSVTGMLLAEYDRLDRPVKDYVYVGNRLLAEYKPVESRMYFYTPDQINSTRIVTDESGTVVYSAAHDPYGGIQQTWANTYDPTPKFSGKERDSESGLDYFGARYYDKGQYRFISVDPFTSRGSSVYNPQRTHLYTYCAGNPISFMDPDGRYLISVVLPGLNTILAASFANLVGSLVSYCNLLNIPISFTSGLRLLDDQQSLRKSNNNAANLGWHLSGYAVDINYFGLDGIQQYYVVTKAKELGMRWGGDFQMNIDSNGNLFGWDPIHLDKAPSSGSQLECYIQAEIQMANLGYLSSDELYFRYGVFTIGQAQMVIWADLQKKLEEIKE